MATLLYSQGALEDLGRLADFLQEDDPDAALATSVLIMHALEMLATHPLMGRPIAGDMHELIISRGRTGYVAVYEYHTRWDRVVVLGIRHQREAGLAD